MTQIEKIVVVAADLVSMNANTSIVERAKGRQRLGKEPGLYLFCNFEFLVGAALRFQLLGNSAALRFDSLRNLRDTLWRLNVKLYLRLFLAGLY